jgi:hypothetical protein
MGDTNAIQVQGEMKVDIPNMNIAQHLEKG